MQKGVCPFLKARLNFVTDRWTDQKQYAPDFAISGHKTYPCNLDIDIIITLITTYVKKYNAPMTHCDYKPALLLS